MRSWSITYHLYFQISYSIADRIINLDYTVEDLVIQRRPIVEYCDSFQTLAQVATHPIQLSSGRWSSSGMVKVPPFNVKVVDLQRENNDMIVDLDEMMTKLGITGSD